ncbi:MAG: Nif3-like dinuclear metal center hexameric protein [Methanocalculus sp. MSAO_Arc1]|uniref:Nif3-like dinuclear metal center hexameric protein n=1 Tax=Methanocalculus TaxID=71151 RepID=UPI000FF0A10D|nr:MULTISPECIES: Nif3-like dinuclear metal center hexameric protein [unclassified Methanocalculus]MCP1662779.1 dinuclear metal center YbgI/SA1388 family protein [Methanocalculus sp. AMF5]RQD81078.1 MAG: Nif3-like dinuclear metal center hexameric protein [Methanocalculus sp. MSAO_Arc1]
MNISAFLSLMEEIAPTERAEEFDSDKIGLVVEGKEEINQICAALDPTQNVIEAAAALQADMLVVHHTPLFTPVTRITGQTARILRTLLSNEMNLFVMHTNFDHADGGINDALADLIGLSNRSRMSLGIVGDCGLNLKEILEKLGCGLRIYGTIEKTSRIAVVGGSGFRPELMQEALDLGADVLISSEMKHSNARIAPLPCIEATHYSLESPGIKDISRRMGWTYIDDPPESCIFI